MSNMRNLLESIDAISEEESIEEGPYDNPRELDRAREGVAKQFRDEAKYVVKQMLVKRGMDERDASDTAEQLMRDGFVNFAQSVLKSRGF